MKERTYNENLAIVTKDVAAYDESQNHYNGSTRQYVTQWIARLQTQNQGLYSRIDTADNRLTDARNGLTDADLEVVELEKRIGEKDAKIADLLIYPVKLNEMLDIRDGLRTENGDLALSNRQLQERIETLEACNEQQVTMLKESNWAETDRLKSVILEINGIVYRAMGK